MTEKGHAATRAGDGRTALAVCVALVVAVVGLYAQTAHFEFVSLDDYYLLVMRPEVRAGLTWNDVRWALTAVEPSWQPLTWITHQLDFSLFGAAAGPPHLVSAGLHAATAVLCFLALRALTGALWPSALVAALFALHPLRAESVAWVSERKDVLSGLFWMLALLAWAAYARRGGVGRYLLVALALILGLTAKTMVMSLPLVLLLLDVWPLQRWSRASDARPLLIEKLPLFGIAAAALVMTLFTQWTIGGLRSTDETSIGWRLVNAPLSYVTYLLQTAWPSRVGVTYSHPAFVAASDFTTYVWLAVGCAAVLIAITALSGAALRRAPYLLVGWLWYVVTIVPVIGIVQAGRQGHADRFTYLPMLGVYIMVAWGLRDLVARWPRARTAVLAVVGLGLGLCSAVSYRQIATWHDTRSIFAHAIAIADDNYFAEQTLGAWLVSTGDLDAGRAHLQQALRISPDSAYALEQLGLVLERQGDRDGAAAVYERALALSPISFYARRNLAAMRAAQGRRGEQIALLLDAVPYSPTDVQLRQELGTALLEERRYDEALTQLQRAVELAPDSASAHDSIAIALVRLNRLAEAEPHLARAAALNPGNTMTQQRLTWVREQLGKP